jgi:hypothetical protein
VLHQLRALEEVISLTRRLRMPHLRSAALDVVPTARAQRRDPAELLRVLLSEEISGRDRPADAPTPNERPIVLQAAGPPPVLNAT